MKSLLVIASIALCTTACSSDSDTRSGSPSSSSSGSSGAASETRHGFPVATPQDEGLDSAALDALAAHAEKTESAAVIILRHGRLVYENHFKDKTPEKPMLAMSASKSIVSIAVGMLIEEGKLSLESKASDFIPEWKADAKKSQIRIKHLLNMTSGLDAETRAMLTDSLESFASTVSMNFAPGDGWRYSNAGVDFLGLVFERAAGEDLESYLNARFFRPIGASPTTWLRTSDRHILAAGEMEILPVDLARVGQVILNGGAIANRPVVPKSWLDASFAASSTSDDYGYLFWRKGPTASVGITTQIIAQWRANQLREDVVAKVEALVGQTFPNQRAFLGALSSKVTSADWSYLNGEIAKHAHLPITEVLKLAEVKGVAAHGYMGEMLYVKAKAELVAVRMYRPTIAASQNSAPFEYPEFFTDVDALTP